MRRAVALVALGVLAAATPVILGPGADAQKNDRLHGSGNQSNTIEIGKTENVDADMSYLSSKKRVLNYPGSDYVKVHFSRMMLAPDDYVTVSNPDYTEVHKYSSTNESMWSTSISGESAVVQLHTSRGLVSEKLAKYGARIDKAAHGMTDEEKAAEESKNPQPESVCGNDDQKNAACYESNDPDVFAHAAPVARLLIDGTTLCSAWRVGDQNRLLTNNHCFDSTQQARDTEVWFNYSCASCKGEEPSKPVKVNGDKVLATDSTYDFTLFSVDDFDKIADFGYLKLADRKAKANEKLYIPQHPNGDPTQIAMDSDSDEGACRVDQPEYDGYASGSDVSYLCDTDFGSSGSPVISRDTNEVIALHHFGGCPNSGVRADRLLQRIGGQL